MLILVRHSTSAPDPNRSAHEWGLSAHGRERCALLAARLRPYQPEVIVTSTEPKARETGTLTAHHLEIPVEVAEGLHEQARHSVPWFEDKAAFVAAVSEVFRQPEELVFGDETGAACVARFETALDGVIAAHPGGRIAVVTHGTVMTLFIAHHNDIDAVQLWQGLGMPAFVTLRQSDYGLMEVVNEID